MDEQRLHFMRVEPGAFAVLTHVVSDGKLVDVLPVPVLAFLLEDGVPRYATTLQGHVEVGMAPLWGPEGSVVMGPNVWPSIEVYFKWAKGNMQ